ncbi:MAG: PAS domain-containing protein [Alphaproteobacteria bacterium]|jgi:hypothetical protein|nr:PAS domain-containing protein [Alphaproteobacteria bacterium]
MSDKGTDANVSSVERTPRPGSGETWRKSDPDLNFDDQRLFDLVQYWHGKRGSRVMPARQEIDVLELKLHLGRIHITELEYEPFRMRYRLIGSISTGIVGRDMTGRYFDEIYPPEILAGMHDVYGWIAENRKPLRGYGSAIFANKSTYTFETVNLPLSDDGEVVNMVVGEIIYTPTRQGGGTGSPA